MPRAAAAARAASRPQAPEHARVCLTDTGEHELCGLLNSAPCPMKRTQPVQMFRPEVKCSWKVLACYYSATSTCFAICQIMHTAALPLAFWQVCVVIIASAIAAVLSDQKSDTSCSIMSGPMRVSGNKNSGVPISGVGMCTYVAILLQNDCLVTHHNCAQSFRGLPHHVIY